MTGYSLVNLRNNSGPDYLPGESFFSIFGLFFATVTGILAGINMSGDLADPFNNIPTGTLSALGVRWECVTEWWIVVSSCSFLQDKKCLISPGMRIDLFFNFKMILKWVLIFRRWCFFFCSWSLVQKKVSELACEIIVNCEMLIVNYKGHWGYSAEIYKQKSVVIILTLA